MNRSKTMILAALATAAAPLPALAQAWPASVVAAAPRALPAPSRPFIVLSSREAAARPLPGARPTDPTSLRPSLKLTDDGDEVPDVELRPKAEWSDDEGLRVTPAKVAFKHRF